jgi:Sec-independent protein translocase protein TatA
MSGTEWAAVVGAQVCLVALVVLVVGIVRLDRAARDLRDAATDFRAEAEPALAQLREVVRTAEFELDRVDAIVSGAERVGERVDAASDLAYRTFTNPVVKALAVSTGTRRAVQRLKGDKPARPEKRTRKAS